MNIALSWKLVIPAAIVAVAGGLGAVAMLPAAAQETALSQGKTATASSVEGRAWPASAAVDGDSDTRWSSQFSDPQWLQLDLGVTTTFDRVVLQWERAYAKAFKIQVSEDAAMWTDIYATTAGTGGLQTLNVTASARYVRMYGTARATGYGYSLYEFQVFAGSAPAPSAATGGSGDAASGGSGDAASGGSGTALPMPTEANVAGWVMAPNPVTNVKPSHNIPPNKGGFHEFQANCSVSRPNVGDDPIVFPNLPGASHLHTFMGNTTTNAASTLESLSRGQTTCKAKGDLSGYWQPTLFNGDTPVNPEGPQVIYYKTGVTDYESVRPFPKGLRFIVGNAKNLDADKFLAATEEGFECGNSYFNKTIPLTCSAERSVKLNIRYQAPSCWDGLHLDSPDHKSHMAYPIDTNTAAGWVCPDDHPVAVPKLEVKMAWPVNGDMSQVHFSSGAGPTYHYDFFNVWDDRTLAAMVAGCIVAARQCDAQGHDGRDDQQPAPYVLNSDYVLP
jgi:hypothetical protein